MTTPNFQFPTSKPSGSKQLSERPPGCYNAATFARLLRGIRSGVGSWALVIVAFAAVLPAAQDPVPPAAGQEQQGGRGRGRGGGPNFPQQQRQLADAAVLARGKGLYESTCSACHGIDLRGGQQGGPNLLRSQVLLSDKAGEAITPIVRGGRPNPPGGVPPMPPFACPMMTSRRSRNISTACSRAPADKDVRRKGRQSHRKRCWSEIPRQDKHTLPRSAAVAIHRAAI